MSKGWVQAVKAEYMDFDRILICTQTWLCSHVSATTISPSSPADAVILKSTPVWSTRSARDHIKRNLVMHYVEIVLSGDEIAFQQ